jgi:hypothetical protein
VTFDPTATASKLASGSKKIIKCGDGTEFQIRKVTKVSFLAAGVNGPFFGGDEDTSKPAAREAEAKEWGVMLDVALRKGLVNPRVWDGAEAKCPADAVMFHDLASYEMELFSAILEFSGMASGVMKAATFPDAEGPGTVGVSDGKAGGKVAT